VSADQQVLTVANKDQVTVTKQEIGSSQPTSDC
jgi:hypothetical protein